MLAQPSCIALDGGALAAGLEMLNKVSVPGPFVLQALQHCDSYRTRRKTDQKKRCGDVLLWPSCISEVPVFKGRPCCLEDLPEVMCVSQETCDQNFAAAVGWSAAGVLLAAGLLCRFYFKRSGTDISSGRCCSWCMKMLSPVVGLFVALLLVAYFSFQHIWQDVTPAAAREVCAWWAAWGLMLMLAAVCQWLSYQCEFFHQCCA